jgi:hypothetical protein
MEYQLESISSKIPSAVYKSLKVCQQPFQSPEDALTTVHGVRGRALTVLAEMVPWSLHFHTQEILRQKALEYLCRMSPPTFMARYVNVLGTEVIPALRDFKCPGNVLPCDFCTGEEVDVHLPHLKGTGCIISVVDDITVVVRMDTLTADVVVQCRKSELRSRVPLPSCLINPQTGKLGSKQFLRNVLLRHRRCPDGEDAAILLSNKEMLQIMPLHVRNRVFDTFIGAMSSIPGLSMLDDVDEYQWLPFNSLMHSDVHFKHPYTPMMPSDVYRASPNMFCSVYDFMTCVPRRRRRRRRKDGETSPCLELRFPGDCCTVLGTTYVVPACKFSVLSHRGKEDDVVVVDFLDFNLTLTTYEAQVFEHESHCPHACAIFDDGSAAFTPWGLVFEPFLRAWGSQYRAFYEFIIDHGQWRECTNTFATIDRSYWSKPIRKQRSARRMYDLEMMSVVTYHEDKQYTETRPVPRIIVDASSVLRGCVVEIESDGCHRWYVDCTTGTFPVSLPDDDVLCSLTMWMMQGRDYIPYRLADVMNACAELGMDAELDLLAYFIAPTFRYSLKSSFT